MKRLLLVSLLIASPAFAEAMLADDDGTVAVDCTKDKAVMVSGNHNTITIKGKCTSVMLSGNTNTVTGESTIGLEISGNENTVNVGRIDSIRVSGDNNKVSWKKPATKPKTAVADTGDGNKLAKTK